MSRKPRPGRRPETYASVSEWYADDAGYVPITMAHALSKLTATGTSFRDAYLESRRRGAIVEIDPAADDASNPAGI